ncbi:phospholipase [Clostridium polyendosporum]|uniref:Phospholipase n=1 Tax=Clostridium polyendosporum TaxID=69208 RepID=A0A919RVZ3_9CLOT|nr:patatin-like phospholipase family protein [Clostridium polyendosporum]GIM27411.1 phospholipase [Clostridium polyendosporum]
MKADAIFQGGGVKGIGFVGAICYLEEQGYTWGKLAGTSAGALVASLLAVGYKGSELKQIITDLNYKKFLDKNKIQSIPLLGKTLGLFKYKGIYCGNYIENWLNELLNAKGKIKFKDISVKGKSPLKIIASDIIKREMLILPDDIIKYGIDPMEFEIAKAVRMSTSIPFYFNPVQLTYDKCTSFIVDGGLLSNFPIWIFDVKEIPKRPTFGFKFFTSKKNCTSSDKTTFVSYLLDIIATVLERNEEVYLNDKDAVRTMSIPTLGITTTQFDITKKESLRLFEEGYNTARQFLSTWNFGDYVRKYRT